MKKVFAILFGFLAGPASATGTELIWPDTDPPGQGGGGGLNINGTQYKKAETSPGRWQWVRDDAAMKFIADRERHKRELYWALRSRVLTDEEMKEVDQYGDGLNIEPMIPFSRAEKSKELNDALLTQFRMREAARRI